MTQEEITLMSTTSVPRPRDRVNTEPNTYSHADRAAVDAYLRSADPEAVLSLDGPSGDDRPDFVNCDTPGRYGCGSCDGCCEWGDQEHDRIGDER